MKPQTQIETENAILEAFAECFGYSLDETTLSEALEAYAGEHYSTADFAEAYVSETHDLSTIPSFLSACIDWEQVWRSCLRFDFREHEGHFFHSNH